MRERSRKLLKKQFSLFLRNTQSRNCTTTMSADCSALRSVPPSLARQSVMAVKTLDGQHIARVTVFIYIRLRYDGAASSSSAAAARGLRGRWLNQHRSPFRQFPLVNQRQCGGRSLPLCQYVQKSCPSQRRSRHSPPCRRRAPPAAAPFFFLGAAALDAFFFFLAGGAPPSEPAASSSSSSSSSSAEASLSS